MASERLDDWIGKTLGKDQRYRLEALVGQGGMGKVYKALDQHLSQEGSLVYRAIKFMTVDMALDEASRDRFQREMQACFCLKDHRIVQMLGYGVVPFKDKDLRWQTLPYLVLEFVDGPTLETVLKTQLKFTVLRAVQLARQISAVLQVMHTGVKLQDKTVRFVHRDLKPSNIFLTQDETGQEIVKMGDLGLVKLLGDLKLKTLTRFNQTVGTPRYSAPEQCQGFPLDGRADLYSLGCILYELLSGTNPFNFPAEAVSTLWMNAHVDRKPLALPPELEIPKALNAIIFRCLEKEPSERFNTAHELNLALGQVERSLTT